MASQTDQQPVKLWHIALLLAVPLAANLPALLGLVTCDPMLIYSGLGRHLNPGLIPGNACFLDPTVGYITQPLGYLSAEDWLHGIIPWWNPYSGVGMPLAAEMQNESFFLPFVLLLHFKSGWLYQRLLFQILSGLFTYGFLRARHLHNIAALTGALLFALNGSFFLHAGAASGPIFCLPLMMLGIERAAAASLAQQSGGWSFIAAGLAISIYAGFPEIAFFDGLLVAVWVIFRGLQLPSATRLIYLRKIATALAIGIAITAPLIIPFISYLSLADLAAHGDTFLSNVLPPAAAPVAILPFIYGALGLAVPPDLQSLTGDMWVKFGGWIGCLPFLFAVTALVRAEQDRRARFLLAAWLAAWLARDFNFLDIRVLFNLLPVIAHADAVRFSWVACEFAAYTLTAYGLNDLLRCHAAKRSQIMLLAFVLAICVATSVAAAFPVLKIWFASQPQTAPYATAYLSICFAACVGAIYAIATDRLVRFVPAGLIAGALAICLAPQLAAPSGGSLDRQAIATLQSISGFSRIYTVGPFGPNFPARYAIASINHSQLPAPKLWTDFITNNLFPGGNVIDFTGNETDQIYGLISNLPDYEAIGVKFILTAPGQNLADWKPPPQQITARSALVTLVSQSEISGTIAPVARDVIITSASLYIGTEFGESTGPLNLQLCAGNTCASGEIDTATIPDDSRESFTLDRPLPVAKDTSLSFTLSHPKGAWVSVFLAGSTGTGDIAAHITADQSAGLYFERSHSAPAVHYTYARTIPPHPTDPTSLKLVYADDLISIHELADAAPYATVSDPGCSLRILSRQHVITNCPHPGFLTRRELFYPGWQARINHRETLITNASGLFQSIAVPAGPADIRFSYEPMHTHFACVIAILAALAWLFPSLRTVRRVTV